MQSLLRLDPQAHLKELHEHNALIRQIEMAKEAGKGSIVKKAVASCILGEEIQGTLRRDSAKESIRRSITRHQEFNSWQIKPKTKDLRRAAFRATRSIYGVILLSMMPVFGISVIALTISWNTVPIELYGGMTSILRILTYIFQACFAMIVFFVWDANSFFAYTDIAVCSLLVPIGNWYLNNKYGNNGVLQPPDITLSCLLTAYLTARVWAMAVKPRHCSWRSCSNGKISTLDRLEIVWVTRSSNLVVKILPDVDKLYTKLVQLWGHDYAREVCRISVYLTDRDKRQVHLLQKELQKSTLYKHGCILLGRPNFEEVIQDYTLELICTRRNSYSLLAFCGSPQLASQLHQAKISNEMITSITGNKQHQLEYLSESFGGVTKAATETSSTPDSSFELVVETIPDEQDKKFATPPPCLKRGSSGQSLMSSCVDTVYSGSHQQEEDANFTFSEIYA